MISPLTLSIFLRTTAVPAGSLMQSAY